VVRAGAKERWHGKMSTHPGDREPGFGGPRTTHSHSRADLLGSRRRSLWGEGRAGLGKWP
jgi:hypothetical protein